VTTISEYTRISNFNNNNNNNNNNGRSQTPTGGLKLVKRLWGNVAAFGTTL
jgi:hypothetical protein